MDLENSRNTDIWELYEKHLNFMYKRKIYTDSDLNYRMYNGDQWAGLKIDGIEKIQHNVIKQIVKQKVSTITSNLFAVNYSPENIENNEFMETAQTVCDLLNKKASKVYDKDFMDKKIKRWAKDSSINDEAICYTYYGENENIPINEIISKNDIMYGDENDEDIQSQPYILIRRRETIERLKEIAKELGIEKEQIDTIVGDKDTSTVAGESAKDEVDDKAWLLTKFYRKDGKVYYSQSTRYCNIKVDECTEMTLYPFAHWNWEEQEGNARGVGEVRQLIPNQLEINKTAMRRALSVKNTAYPQKVVNISAIQNKSAINKIGSTIEFKDNGMNLRASDVFMNTNPAQMSTDSEKFQNELINLTRELNNASEATTGTINPESASGKAILAVQQAQNQPLSDQLIGLKTFIEDIARIWFEIWKVYATDGITIETEEIDEITGKNEFIRVRVPNYILEELQTSVKVDITPKGAFDKYAQELSLENMYTTGKITFDEYVESLDTDSVMPKVKLEKIRKKRKEAQQQIDQLDIEAQQMKQYIQERNASAMDIETIAQTGNNLINQATQTV